jgi:RNA polymerase sigma-70 factor, ECF subfamily
LADGQAHDSDKGITLPRVSTDTLARAPAVAPPTAAGDFSLDAFLAGIATRAFRFAELGLRHREDALDAVQDAMMKMLQYRERPAEEWTPLFWSILRSRIVDVQRRSLFRLRWLAPASRHHDDEDGGIDWLDERVADQSMPDPSRAHDGREAYAALADALRALPRRQREAFTLRILEECDVATTAQIMGCGEGAVKTHLSRAREALQRKLEDFR